MDPNAEVDPSRICNVQEQVISLASCKDNCKGGIGYNTVIQYTYLQGLP